MTDATPLDNAHREMERGGDRDRLRYYERLADAELFLMLAHEMIGDQIEPQVYPVEDDSYVLVFDRIERLAEFAGQMVPYAAMSGRAVINLLAGHHLGLGVNLGSAPSSILLPTSAVNWLAKTLATRPQEKSDRPTELRAPKSVPEGILNGLHTKLALAAGLARSAYLAEVLYDTGRNGHLLAFVDARPGAETALSQAVSEVLVFSGIEAGEIDVAFFATSDPICARLARAGLRFDLPDPVKTSDGPTAPGMDPDSPPKLR